METGPTASGCCYSSNIESIAFSADLCQEYWTADGCSVSYDVDGQNNCRWRPTDDDVDCDGLRTFVNAVSRRENQLFGDNTMIDQATKALDGEVSLMTVLMVSAAMFVLYRLYCCWNSVRNHWRNDDGYEKSGDGQWNRHQTGYGTNGYQSMA